MGIMRLIHAGLTPLRQHATAALHTLRRRAAARRAGRDQAGTSVTELVVLTAPLCVLSIILSSQLAATSSAHLRAEWMASVAAQQQAAEPCGGNPRLNAPIHPEADPGLIKTLAPAITLSGIAIPFAASELFGPSTGPGTWQTIKNLPHLAEFWFRNPKILATKVTSWLKANPTVVANILLTVTLLVVKTAVDLPEDLLTSPELLESNWVESEVSVPIAPYYFQSQAEALLGPTEAVRARATFVCNESVKGDAIRAHKREQLLTRSVFEASGIFP